MNRIVCSEYSLTVLAALSVDAQKGNLYTASLQGTPLEFHATMVKLGPYCGEIQQSCIIGYYRIKTHKVVQVLFF